MSEKTNQKKELYRIIAEMSCITFLLLVPVASYTAIAHWKSYTVDDYTIVTKEAGVMSGFSENQADETMSVGENAIPYITETRTVKEYRGGLGVYDCFGNLLSSHEVNLSFLNTDDRKSLKDGIVFESESKTYEFIELFDS